MTGRKTQEHQIAHKGIKSPIGRKEVFFKNKINLKKKLKLLPGAPEVLS